MKIKTPHIIGLTIGFAIIIMGLIFSKNQFSFFMIWFGAIVGVLPFVLTTIQSNKTDQEMEAMFLEFTRNLVESVKTGTSISKSLTNLKKKNFGSLSKHIEK